MCLLLFGSLRVMTCKPRITLVTESVVPNPGRKVAFFGVSDRQISGTEGAFTFYYPVSGAKKVFERGIVP